MTRDPSEEMRSLPLKMYVGFEPTADSLHLGNLVGLVALSWFQRFGHQTIVLLGTGTGKIGDPSGKDRERPLMDKKHLSKNARALEKQIKGYLSPSVLFLDNDQWLSSYPCVDFLRDVGRHFRLGAMLSRESVRSRLRSNRRGMSFTEFAYPLFQGYDFYHLYSFHQVMIQMGGEDQWGNITAGVDLVHRLTGKNVYGLTHPLLTRADGKKFGKSEEGTIWLNPQKSSPYQLYQYLFHVTDQEVTSLMRLLTFIDLEEILSLERESENGTLAPNRGQKRLAEEVVRFVHGEDYLRIAIEETRAIHHLSSGTLTPQMLEQLTCHLPRIACHYAEIIGERYSTVAAKISLVQSRGEGIRLIKNRGAFLNNERVTDPHLTIQREHLIGGKYLLFGVGKKRKCLVYLLPEPDIFSE